MSTHEVMPTRQRMAIVTLLGSAASNQLGAAVGSLAFPLIGPVGVVAVRQFVAAAVLLPLVRPRIWAFTWRQWWPILLLSLVFGLMNLTLYLSIDRIGLGLAVTLEFLGPLGVALAGSRSRGAILCAIAATLGVVAITQPQPTTDYIGVGLALVAACCWAAYILLNRTVGHRVPGVVGVAAASGISATLFLPVGLVIFISNPPSPFAILCAVAAGILASAVPYVTDLVVLRRVPATLFSLLMSVNPIFAALVGAVVLSQALDLLEWAGIVLIVGANVIALLLGRPRARRRVGVPRGGAARPGRAALWRGPLRRRGSSLRRGR